MLKALFLYTVFMTQNYQFHGHMCSGTELIDFIEHILEMNLQNEALGLSKVPLCIWGRHGVGKTQMVRDLCRQKGWAHAYAAPAQFEEMGDLTGMPKIDSKGTPEIDDDETVLVPPKWVPKTEGPGILLLDDVNRADERILRGIMQLLQDGTLVSWKLPPKWQIVLTANPDGGDYAVTPMDNAMLTRMLHVSARFDVKAWVQWARKANIDPRGIDFVSVYPELVDEGEKTTPRSLVYLFNLIRPIQNLAANMTLLRQLAHSSLDALAADTFIRFVTEELTSIPTAEEILHATHFAQQIEPKLEALQREGSPRVDILTLIGDRLVRALKEKVSLDTQACERVRSFVQSKSIPDDVRFNICRELISLDNVRKSPLGAEIGKIANEVMHGT